MTGKILIALSLLGFLLGNNACTTKKGLVFNWGTYCGVIGSTLFFRCLNRKHRRRIKFY
jgi:hypothetical protein